MGSNEIKYHENDSFLQHFKDMIRRIFHTKASNRLSDMFGNARKTLKKPRWLGDDMCNRLLAHWNTSAYHPKFA
ncbi:hypothetical protein JHK82_027756 [Glycine max]|nr:hypothetical protein JHK82_027756 [Glycine max]